ncbi:hypothetical protein [Spirosoma jeollabukense]
MAVSRQLQRLGIRLIIPVKPSMGGNGAGRNEVLERTVVYVTHRLKRIYVHKGNSTSTHSYTH